MGPSDRGRCAEHRGKLSAHNTEVSLVSVIWGLQPIWGFHWKFLLCHLNLRKASGSSHSTLILY